MRPEQLTDSVIRAYRAGQDSVLPTLQQEMSNRQAAEDIAKTYEELSTRLRREADDAKRASKNDEQKAGDIRRELVNLTTRWSGLCEEQGESDKPFVMGTVNGLEIALKDVLRVLGYGDEEEDWDDD